MIHIDQHRLIYERGEPGFDQAWETLIASGLNPRLWMYMESIRGTGGPHHRFKCIRTREYITVSPLPRTEEEPTP